MVRVVLDDCVHVDLKPLVNDENTLKSEMIYRLNEVRKPFVSLMCITKLRSSINI